MELYDRWAEVYFDLESVGEQEVLNHTPTIRDFVKLLPGEAIVQCYVATEKELSAKGESALAIVKAFMKSERSSQRKLMELMGAKESANKDPCGGGLGSRRKQPGHEQGKCSGVTPGRAKRSHGTQRRGPRKRSGKKACHRISRVTTLDFLECEEMGTGQPR